MHGLEGRSEDHNDTVRYVTATLLTYELLLEHADVRVILALLAEVREPGFDEG